MADKISKLCDKALVALAGGDDNAMNIIYDNTARLIFTVAYSVLENHHDAEDVLQETMIKIYRHADTYKKGNNAKAWILRIARNTALDKAGKKPHAVSIEQIKELEDADSALGTESLIYDEHAEVFKMLDILDDDDRQLVLLRLKDELSYKEIAYALNMTVSTAQKRYQRAIHRLRCEYCGPEYDERRYGNE